MANHKSALKRARQNKVHRMRNAVPKTRAKTAVKAVRAAADTKDAAKAREALREAAAALQKAAAKGVIHRKRAARKVSRLARLVNKRSLS
ncbi:MAG: 30S ribosomal protein S20 [Thermodesulfobacteriota bacterium]